MGTAGAGSLCSESVRVALVHGDLSVKERAGGQKGFGCRERSGCVETGLRGDGSMGVMMG